MKILAIRGKNLASLEQEFEIDFTKEPLLSAGIYAITGQTGAGKSTILDALCLALFDNAPRTDKATENVKIDDVQDNKITQKDSRNILRKGAAEGYAEVQFLALNAKTYQSRWSVSRSRGKATGTLKTTEIKLFNQTDSHEESGTKKELLDKICELIGLNFAQFTRAVLLAQGDFATFLKAKSDDKAELLEKLTGTDIYSKISISIYEKAEKAKQELQLITQRINDIDILKDEDIEEWNKQQQLCAKNIPQQEAQISIIDKKLDWINQRENLLSDAENAKKALTNIQEQITDNKHRFQYIEQIDLCTDISDIYKQNKQNNTILSANQQSLSINLQELEKHLITHKQTEKDILEAKNKQTQFEEHIKKQKPEIEKAKTFDITIETTKKERDELLSDLKNRNKQKSETEESIHTSKTKRNKLIEETNNIKQWINEKQNWKPIAEQGNQIIDKLDQIRQTKINETKKEQELNQFNQELKNNTLLIEQTEKQYNTLNELLPTEILELRSKLEEGKPCPVCGSIHHNIIQQTEKQQAIKQGELEKQKQTLQDLLVVTKEKVENIKSMIIQAKTLISNNKEQQKQHINTIKDNLSSIPNWQDKITDRTLQKHIATFSLEWQKKQENVTTNESEIKIITATIETEQKNLNKIEEQINEKKNKINKVEYTYQNQINQRKAILGGTNIATIEQNAENDRNKINTQIENLRKKQETQEKEIAALQAIIQKTQQDNTTITDKISQDNKKIEEWLKKNQDKISAEQLPELLSKTNEWIKTEKKQLQKLKDEQLASQTRHKERQQKIQEHNHSEQKPQPNETKEELTHTLTIVKNQYNETREKQSECKAILKKHQENHILLKKWQKDMEKKQATANNWGKLNEMFGSATGKKFKTIAQGYTLDILLSYANKHLKTLTKRYELQKIQNSLALQVIDNDMMGEVRTVHSLSGGESFLISLALALSLSSLSSHQMNIESLFIDEGFGSLDLETLTIAMDALENLQTQGRKIGIISHVSEMTERIKTQIQIKKTMNGKSYVTIKK